MLGRSAALAAFAVVLVAPAAASAATFTVDKGAPLGCDANRLCSSVSAANAAAGDGDTIQINAGTYEEPGPVQVTRANLTFTATPGTVTVRNADGTAGAAVFDIGDGTTLRGLIVDVAQGGGQAVKVHGAGASIVQSALERVNATAATTPVLETVAGAGGVTTLDRSLVLQTPNGSTGAAPAVLGGAGASLAISDSTIFAAAGWGPAVTITGSATGTGGSPVRSTITRSWLIALSTGQPILAVSSAASSAIGKVVALDSAMLAGTGSDGINASTAAGNSGPITIGAVHTTIGGVKAPIVATVNADAFTKPGGAISIDLDRSIAHGTEPSRVTAESGGLPSSTGSAGVTIRRSDTTDSPTAKLAISDSQSSTDAEVFANPAKLNYHLRQGSTAIDKGGAPVTGESPTDVDGQARGAVTDLGADEFVNGTPVARLRASTDSVRQGGTVSFDASGSTDPESGAGGGIAHYLWNFGDGTTAVTTDPHVDHVYNDIGTFTATVVAVDGLNAASAAQSAITVTDGVAPVVSIADPKDGKRLHLYVHKTVKHKVLGSDGKLHTVKRRALVLRTLRFGGTATDDSGIRSVEISLRRVSFVKSKKSSAKKKTTAKARRAARKAKACVYLDDKKVFKSHSCRRPTFFPVSQDKGVFTYRVKKVVKLRRGLYELAVRATDGSGLASEPVKVRFRLV